MRSRITIQKPTYEKNRLNEKVVWEDWATDLRARKTWKNGDEPSGKTGTVARAFFEFQIRYIAGITPECRIVNDGRVFNIVSITNVKEQNHELIIRATEVSRNETRGL